MTFYDCCFIIFVAVMFFHYIFLFVDEDSRFKKNRFRKSVEHVYKRIVHMNEYTHDGVKFHDVKVIYKNREFAIGIFKKEHSNRYTTYEIFINGDEAGTFHILGDCCSHSYYFETQNNRYKSEVMDIVHAGAKEVKKLAKATTEKTGGWNEHSYFK
jgi:hypothetical protein